MTIFVILFVDREFVMQISKQKQGMVKNPVSLHEEEKMDTSENPKVASGEQEDCRGEMQQTKNIDVRVVLINFLEILENALTNVLL